MSDVHEELELDGITASLDELVKACDATGVVKSYGGTNVEYSGHYDERGKVGGGGAESGDMGGIDDMMIGKMAQTLIDAGYDAGEIQAFMSAKDDEDEDGEDDGEMFGEMSMAPHQRPSAHGKMRRSARHASGEGEPMVKAMDEFRADSDVADAIDVSPFLEALTVRTADQLDAIRKSLGEHRGQSAKVQRATAAAIYQIGTLQKGMADVLSALNERLGLIEHQPAEPRGVRTLSGARALHKSVRGEVGGGEALSKADVVGALTYMNLEKGIRDIGGRPTGQAAMMLEGGGVVDQQIIDAVSGFLAAHPAEADAARNYR